MSSAMKMLCALVFAVLVFPVGAQAEFRAESLENDFPAEIADAREDGKRLVLMFHLNSCPFCDKMRDRVFPNARIQDYFSANFIMLETEINGDLPVVTPSGDAITEKMMARKYRVRATPVFIFFDLDGNEVSRVTGYQDVATFLKSGQYVVDEVYKSGKSLARYQLEKR